MWKKAGEKEPRPRYGITPQAFIELGWFGMLAAIMLAGKILQWLTN